MQALQQRCAAFWTPDCVRKPALLARTRPPSYGLSRLHSCQSVHHRRSLVLTPRIAAVEVPIAAPTVDAPTSQPGQPQHAVQGDSRSDAYNWFATWYPVAGLLYLKTDRPNPVQLLGLHLVVWKDSSGQWNCFEDVCSHRLAPLSEGRIHPTLGLQCSYHGWTFNPDGTCSSIPQIKDPKAQATACDSQRSCVKRYPVQVMQDMLWVYPDASANAWLHAISNPPTPAPDKVAHGSWEMKNCWFQRDLPVSIDTIIENFMDPSHVNFAHHGVIGHREIDQRMEVQLVGEVSKQRGFTLEVDAERSLTLSYTPPCLAEWEFGGMDLLLYSVPTRVGWSRVIMGFAGPKGKPPVPGNVKLPPLLRIMLRLVNSVIWLQHAANRNAVFDGDTSVLHNAERTLYSRGDHSSWAKQYYMPAGADVAVLTWRKWMDRHGLDLPVLPRSAADLGPPLTREVIFDRYNQHTKHCPHCSSALRNINIALAVLGAVAAVALASVWVAASAAAGAAVPLLSTYTAVHVGVAAVAGALAGLLWRLRRKFIWEDYVHADH